MDPPYSLPLAKYFPCKWIEHVKSISSVSHEIDLNLATRFMYQFNPDKVSLRVNLAHVIFAMILRFHEMIRTAVSSLKFEKMERLNINIQIGENYGFPFYSNYSYLRM